MLSAGFWTCVDGLSIISHLPFPLPFGRSLSALFGYLLVTTVQPHLSLRLHTLLLNGHRIRLSVLPPFIPASQFDNQSPCGGRAFRWTLHRKDLTLAGLTSIITQLRGFLHLASPRLQYFYLAFWLNESHGRSNLQKKDKLTLIISCGNPPHQIPAANF